VSADAPLHLESVATELDVSLQEAAKVTQHVVFFAAINSLNFTIFEGENRWDTGFKHS
jgi:hypothetical protein